jgi:3-methyladenine DNA glycosylase AlkD
MLSAQEYFTQIDLQFQANANPTDALAMKKYMRNQFEFYGIKSPRRKEIGKAFIKSNGRPEGEALKELCHLCFTADHRELQYFLIDLMIPIAKKQDSSFLDLYEELIQTKSWWDTIDFISPRLAGGILMKTPQLIEQYPDQWISSNNIWLVRSAILFQLHFREKTDYKLLFDYILQTRNSKEFFIEKAAGWALRQYSKLNAPVVKQFIESNDLPSLTRKEGLKWMDKHGY